MRTLISNLFFWLLLITVFFLPAGCGGEEEEGGETAAVLETTADPAGGTYNVSEPPTVSLTANRPARVFYSLDGRTPGEGMANTFAGESPVTGIEIAQDTTLKFFSRDEEGNQEAVKTESYEIDVRPVTRAEPPGDGYPGPVTVVLTVNERGCATYYSLDGAGPQATDAYRYSAGSQIQIAGEGWAELKFFSVDGNGNTEEMKTERYKIDTRPPEVEVSPAPGRYLDPISVNLIANEPGMIYYTLDGTDPSLDPAEWEEQGGSTYVESTAAVIGISRHTRIRYFARDEVGNMTGIEELVYMIGETPYTSALPPGGAYNQALEVTFVTQTYAGARAEIYYTTDNTSPDPTDLYDQSSSVSISDQGTTVLRFLAVDEFGYREAEEVEVYLIDSIPPVTRADPAGDVYYEPQQVTLEADEEATICYSFDGADPAPGANNTNSAPSPITNIVISADTVLKFFSIDSLGNQEAVQTEVFYISYRFREDFTGFSREDLEETSADWSTARESLRLKRGEPALLGHYQAEGEFAGRETAAVLPQDEFVFLAAGSRGLRVFDAAFSGDPILVDTVPRSMLAAEPVSLGRAGNHLFLGGPGGLTVLEVSRPHQPEALGDLALAGGGTGQALSLSGDYLYLADGDEGLRTVRIEDPASPEAITVSWRPYPGGVPADPCRDALAAGNVLYTAFAGNGMVVLDISDPEDVPYPNPASLPVTGALSLARDGNLLLIGTEGGELALVDVSDPENPVPVTTLGTCSGPVFSLEIRGVLAYLGCGAEGLVVVNVSDPDSPRIEGSYSGLGRVYQIYSDGSRILAGDGAGGLKIISGSELLSSPPLVGELELEGALGVTRYRNLAYVTRGGDGVAAVDLSDPGRPVLLDTSVTSGARSGRMFGNYLLVADGSGGVRIFDQTAPEDLTPLSALDTTSAYALEIMGNVIAVADGPGGVRLFRLSDPGLPPSSQLGFERTSDARDLVWSGDYLCVADADEGLVVVDVTDPAAPAAAAAVPVAGTAQGVALRGNYLYLAAGSGGLRIYDLSDPGSPEYLGDVDLLGEAEVSRVVSRGNYLFLVSDRGIEVVNNDSPEDPVFLRTVSLEGALDLALWGDYGIAAAGPEGLQVVQLSRESSDYISPGYAQSTPVDEVEGNIIAAEVRPSFGPDSFGEAEFCLSNNGGETWEEFEPYRLQSFTSPGSDLRWRVWLTTPDPTRSPVIEELVVIYKISR